MQLKQYLKNIFRTSHWQHRLSMRRIVLEMTGLLVVLEAITVIILQIISVQRRQHQHKGGFPHPSLDELGVGDNSFDLYDYVRDLYDAMRGLIDAARQSINGETCIWKGDAKR